MSVPDDDGIRALHPLVWYDIGISDRLLVFLGARKGLPMRLYNRISGGRAESLK